MVLQQRTFALQLQGQAPGVQQAFVAVLLLEQGFLRKAFEGGVNQLLVGVRHVQVAYQVDQVGAGDACLERGAVVLGIGFDVSAHKAQAQAHAGAQVHQREGFQ